MAQVRNITDQTLHLACVGREVAPDELCDVPDDIFDAFVWPESTWDVAASAPAPSPKEK